MIPPALRTPFVAALLCVVVPAFAAGGREDPSDEGLVTLEFVDADLRDALRMVGKQCGVNMVISNAVSGTVSLSLEGTTLEETLDALISVGGLDYVREGDIVTVHTVEELIEERLRREELWGEPPPPKAAEPRPLVLHLRYVDAERVLDVVQGMLSELGTVSLLKTSDHVAQQRNGGVAPESTGVELQVGARLSTSSQGEPAKSHTLVVFDQPDRLQRIEEVVRAIDVRPPQVVIEARFVEVSLDDDQRLGIDWNAVASMTGGAVPHTAPFGDSSLGSIDPDVVGGTGSVFPPAPGSVSVGSEVGLFTFGTLDFTTFTALLEFVERNTDMQMVSNPRIVVGDRHTATILVGERFPILSANISEFGAVTEQLDRYEPIGVQLVVTPSVLDDEVELLVRPSSSSLGGLVSGSTGLTVARINARQIDTLVRVKDGQTLVVGGLITSRETDVESKVPLLGSIPLLGKLFQYSATRTERVDLVVFLTVTIVQEHNLTERQRRLFESSTPGGVSSIQEPTPLEFVAPPAQF